MIFVSVIASLAVVAPSLIPQPALRWQPSGVLVQDGVAQESGDVAFAERMVGYEGRRLVLDRAFDGGRLPFPSEDAAALLKDAEADPGVPAWYIAELAALDQSFRLVDGLDEEARANVLKTLGTMPAPGTPPGEMVAVFNGLIGALRGFWGPITRRSPSGISTYPTSRAGPGAGTKPCDTRSFPSNRRKG